MFDSDILMNVNMRNYDDVYVLVYVHVNMNVIVRDY